MIEADLVMGDDHAMFRASSAVLGQQGFGISAARNAAETVESADRNKPKLDCALSGPRPPGQGEPG